VYYYSPPLTVLPLTTTRCALQDATRGLSSSNRLIGGTHKSAEEVKV
jgi:hypothetical protein